MTRRERIACRICGRASLPGRNLCSPCNRGVDRPRGDCSDCQRPDLLRDVQRRCRACRSRADRRCDDCGSITPHRFGVDDARVCDRCALRRLVDQIIPAEPAGTLGPLRPALLAAEPLTTMRWLRRSRDLLTDLDQGRIELDHRVLDGLPRRAAATYLRSLLVAAEILTPDSDGPLRQFESYLADVVDTVAEPDRALLVRWARWHVLAKLRRRQDQGRTIASSTGNARRQVRTAAKFLTVLHARERTVATATQHDIDDWFAEPGQARWIARPFLSWAQRVREMPRELVIPSQAVRPAAEPIDDQKRWQIAKRLLTDDTIDTADRVAAALVVIYGQPVSRIVMLTTAHVEVSENNVYLHLGHHPLDLPEPLATLIQDLPTRRRDGAAAHLPNAWLFAGSHAGAPLAANSLAVRLKKIGIDPRPMRVAATDQLARELPPVVLAEVLGISHRTAARAVSRAGGDWVNYAADRQP